MVNIVLVKENEIKELSCLATEILREHYDPIIGKEQNDYMLKMFQSEEGLKAQIDKGYDIYWVKINKKNAGYISFYPRDNEMYLSKFYLHKKYRGKGYAYIMANYVINKAREKGLTLVTLNVNRFNDSSIKAYEHLGFKVLREEKNDIGNGFFMDDYVMGREVPSKLYSKDMRELLLAGRRIITEKVRKYADIMGVTYGKITIKVLHTRWGSCSSNGNLNFNSLLMLAPDEIIDYVVVHELSHRIHMNHSKEFWQQVADVMPDYKRRERWLKNNSDGIMKRYYS